MNSVPLKQAILCLTLMTSFIALSFAPNSHSPLQKDWMPLSVPHRYFGKDLLPSNPIQSKGMKIHDDVLTLYESGTLRFQIKSDQKTLLPIFLIAKGTPVQNEFPHLSIEVNQIFHTSLSIDSSTESTYSFLLPLQKGTTTFEIEFSNDHLVFPEDRNLSILCLSTGLPPLPPKS